MEPSSITIVDSVEYRIPGFSQIQFDGEAIKFFIRHVHRLALCNFRLLREDHSTQAGQKLEAGFATLGVGKAARRGFHARKWTRPKSSRRKATTTCIFPTLLTRPPKRALATAAARGHNIPPIGRAPAKRCSPNDSRPSFRPKVRNG